jgi:putative NIF3 family GTP cyclohydrolase 1 type 2
MTAFPLDRRNFLRSSLGLASLSLLHPRAQAPLTASQVIDRIKAKVGIPWRDQTVDNLIVGTPDLPVTGIATCMIATLEVIQRAAAKGLNMVVTHEPTFYSHQDRTEPIEDDALYQHKRDFMTKHGICVFHFHDHWHEMQPDGIAMGMMQQLGWEKNRNPQHPRLYTFEETTLAHLAQSIEAKLKIRTMRVLGDPDLPVKQVIGSWGYNGLSQGISYVPVADVLVIGETNEWELVEYLQDAITSGQKKGLIILGHLVSEQAGMKYAAEWLRGFITEVPVEFVASDEPFWLPGQPVK